MSERAVCRVQQFTRALFLSRPPRAPPSLPAAARWFSGSADQCHCLRRLGALDAAASACAVCARAARPGPRRGPRGPRPHPIHSTVDMADAHAEGAAGAIARARRVHRCPHPGRPAGRALRGPRTIARAGSDDAGADPVVHHHELSTNSAVPL